MRLSLKTQAEYTVYGIVGILIPALVVTYTTTPAIVVGAVLLATGTGVYVGTQLRNSRRDDMISGYAEFVDNLQDDIRELREDRNMWQNTAVSLTRQVPKRDNKGKFVPKENSASIT